MQPSADFTEKKQNESVRAGTCWSDLALTDELLRSHWDNVLLTSTSSSGRSRWNSCSRQRGGSDRSQLTHQTTQRQAIKWSRKKKKQPSQGRFAISFNVTIMNCTHTAL